MVVQIVPTRMPAMLEEVFEPADSVEAYRREALIVQKV